MPPTATPMPSLADLLLASPEVAEPDVAGALAVFPLLATAEPRLEYLAFAEARAHGARVTELPGEPSVGDLLVDNPTDHAVLLLEGEELVGAQQDRTLDATVLVPPRSQLQVPVSCVEAGRWDLSRHDEAFAPSERTAFPELRRAKNRAARAALASGSAARADQHEVWRAVEAKLDRHAPEPGTRAMGGAFESRRDALSMLESAIHRRDRQIGALVALGGRFCVLDAVGRPDAYAALHRPLVAGYALDALEHVDAPPAPRLADASRWLAGLLATAVRPVPAIGMGRAFTLVARDSAGTGLEADGELVALCAFAGETGRPGRTRIRRPSERR